MWERSVSLALVFGDAVLLFFFFGGGEVVLAVEGFESVEALESVDLRLVPAAAVGGCFYIVVNMDSVLISANGTY